jgi:hypothetical protein
VWTGRTFGVLGGLLGLQNKSTYDKMFTCRRSVSILEEFNLQQHYFIEDYSPIGCDAV